VTNASHSITTEIKGTLGVLGGGQLGQMLAQAAQKLGYRVHIYTPEKNSPASQVADSTTVAAWDDQTALQRFAHSVDVVTLEFENIPLQAVQWITAITPVYPQPHVLEISQNRIQEKIFLNENGIVTVPFAIIRHESELAPAAKNLGFPAVLKTAASGYDGKGQIRVENVEALHAAFIDLGSVACVLERFVDLEQEISVIAARGNNGEFAAYPPGENRHCNHILETTLAPATLLDVWQACAIDITHRIMERFDMRGILCVEFFCLKGEHLPVEERLLVNEVAPRPHNSGHYTIEATTCSQFEQQARSVLKLPLGDTALKQSAAMINLLGDLWASGEPHWINIANQPDLFLHLYGKSEAKPGRKMGHITALAESPQAALEKVIHAKQALIKYLPA
jgi:5-(carboxyamino)imidazole ribonucleotide synthase